MGVLPFVLPPSEVLKGDPFHLILNQTRTRDPATIATFDRRVTDVIVDSDPARIETLKHSPKIPNWPPNPSGSGLRVIHSADLMFFV